MLNKLTQTLILLITLVFSPLVQAETKKIDLKINHPKLANTKKQYYQADEFFDFIPNAWNNYGNFWRRAMPSEDNWRAWVWMTTSTAILIKHDQELIDNTQVEARRAGLIDDKNNGRETHTPFVWGAYKGIKLYFHLPTNAVSFMYYLGDGVTSVFGVAGGLTIYGMVNDDDKAKSTASQVMESLLITGTTVQIIKRITGRQAPFAARESGNPGGKWQWLPSFDDYNTYVPNYDAVPSGHLATLVATTLVVASNYPKKTWIKPLGYTAMGLLTVGMMINGVHWASDYPFAVGIGYLSAQITLERHQKIRAERINTKNNKRLVWTIIPELHQIDNHHSFGISYVAKF